MADDVWYQVADASPEQEGAGPWEAGCMVAGDWVPVSSHPTQEEAYEACDRLNGLSE